MKQKQTSICIQMIMLFACIHARYVCNLCARMFTSERLEVALLTHSFAFFKKNNGRFRELAEHELQLAGKGKETQIGFQAAKREIK